MEASEKKRLALTVGLILVVGLLLRAVLGGDKYGLAGDEAKVEALRRAGDVEGLSEWVDHEDPDIVRRAPVSYTHLTLPTICSV